MERYGIDAGELLARHGPDWGGIDPEDVGVNEDAPRWGVSLSVYSTVLALRLRHRRRRRSEGERGPQPGATFVKHRDIPP